MCSDTVIRASDLAKDFMIYDVPANRLKQMMLPKLQHILGMNKQEYFRRFSAVKHVSLNVGRGETVGIIGRNGSGKSTLLEMICGTLRPSGGTIEVNGRVAALLELGSGFNPEFTGRENVHLNAAILGLSSLEIAERFDDIAAFADIGAFIDQPVKTYSSGMYVRLAFAVAINVDPDILIIDEALAVGDEAFQRKCFAKLEQIKNRGGTILFVSHSAQSVIQLCDWVVLLDRGEKILEGTPKAVVDKYQRFINLSGDKAEQARREIKAIRKLYETGTPTLSTSSATSVLAADLPSDEAIVTGRKSDFYNAAPDKLDAGFLDPSLLSHSPLEYPTHGAEISDVSILSEAGRQLNSIRVGRRYTVRYTVTFNRAVQDIKFGMVFRNMMGLELAGANNANLRDGFLKSAAIDEQVTAEFSFLCLLLPGSYTLTVGVVGTDENGNEKFLHRMVDCIQLRVLPEENVVDFGYFAMDYEFGLTRGTQPSPPLG
ncbi:teichoic acids export ATP-binding protein TagH [gamma proteobacterium NOR5-3]|nr:teichoic acids export ATP-binding protein TagH [gamma proteobacterium NOR5-3]